MSQKTNKNSITPHRKSVDLHGAQSAVAFDGGDAIDARGSQGPIIKPSGDVHQYWGNVSIQLPTGTPLSFMGGIGTQGSSVVWSLLTNQLEQLAMRMSGETKQHLERMRAAWRRGRRSEAVNGVKELKQDQVVWPVLPADLKAQVLRFEAGLVLDMTGDTNRAKELADQAQTVAPSSSDVRLRAWIAFKESGPEAAIELLAGEDDRDSIHLKAQFLLEMARLEECRTLLENANFEPDAETFHIRGFLYLISNQLPQARLEIQKAQELEPQWQSIKFAGAVINYFSALSPAALLKPLFLSSEPVEWILVKRDEQSLIALEEAADIFREFAEGSDRRREERQRDAGWLLASLANHPERQEEAADYCGAMLQHDRANSFAIVWALIRHLEVDLKPSQTAIEELVADGLATIDQILALISCYIVAEKTKKALKVLEKTREVFQKRGADALWTSWHLHLLIKNGDSEAMAKAIEGSQSKGELRKVRMMQLQALAKQTGDWLPLLEHLESSYQETQNPYFLLNSCDLMAQQQEWAYVADRSEQLVKEIGTSEALSLAVIATNNARRFELCLRLLDEYRYFFGVQKLPRDLRRIRSFCLQTLGILPEAIAEAEALARDDPTSENLLDLARVYLTKGDFRRLALVGSQLIKRPDLSAEHALQMAWMVHSEEQQLAVSLFRQAKPQELPDDAVAAAVGLGFQLGLDKELRELFARMTQLGLQGREDLRLVTIEELVSLINQRHEKGIKLEEAYRDGTAPIHTIAALFKRPLVDLYHCFWQNNEVTYDPRRQFSLLVRHGGRTLISGFPDEVPEWSLNLDVTAVLLAAHLGILDEVERAFKPLHIPMALIPALVRMRERVKPHQPSRLEAYRKIIKLAENGLLNVIEHELPPSYANPELVEELGKEWVALFEKARASGGYLVGFLPLKKRDGSGPPSALPEDASQYLVNCRGVVDALRQKGPLSNSQYRRALEALGTEGQKIASSAIPRVGACLFCDVMILEVLATAGLLRVVCQRFKVYIEKRELDESRSALKEHDQKETAKWLRELINRLSQGIDDGIYQVIPSVPDKKDELEDPSLERLEEDCLLTLMKFKAREGDVVWVDDRFVTRYLHRDGVPIIGINEVLKSLVAVGALAVNDYYDKVNQLRAANVRFIPVEAGEILYHLNQARIENQTIVETQGLIVLRRYVAACLLQGETLQQPKVPAEPNEMGEIAFILGLSHAITNALCKIWVLEEQDENTCRARAEWLLNNLYLNHLGLRSLISLPSSEEDERYLVATSLAGLISVGFVMMPSVHSNNRHKYLDWLFERLLKKRFDVEPYLVIAVADILKNLLLGTQEDVSKELPEHVVMVIIQAFYEHLPKPILHELQHDADFMRRIGLMLMKRFILKDLSFDADEFLQAASEALNGREATIIPFESDTEVTFRPFEEELTFSFEHPATGSRTVVRDDRFALWVDSPTGREAALRRDRQWFDCPNDEFEQAVAKIASVKNPRQRIEQLESWLDSSAAVYYANLHQQISQNGSFEFPDLLPPSAEGLLRHFRLTPDIGSGQAVQDGLATAAQTLIREEGLRVAIERLSGLPVPLPAILVETMLERPPKERHALIKELEKTGSPVCKIHLVYLLLHFDDEKAIFRWLAQRIIGSLLSAKGVEELDAFFALLKWVNDEFGYWSEARLWPPHIRLAMAWAHTHRLFSIFVSLDIFISWLRDTFRQAGQRISSEAFDGSRDYWFDIGHPRQVNPLTFLFTGLSYALGEEAENFIDEELRELFVKKAFVGGEDSKIPAWPLLRKPTQLPNSLNSFLGGDISARLPALLGVEKAKVFTLTSHQALAEEAIDKLEDARDEFLAWRWVDALLGDWPPVKHLAERLKSIICQTDFVGLFEKSIDLGLAAMQCASQQAIGLGDEELCAHLKEQIVKSAQFFANRESDQVSESAMAENGDSKSQERSLFLVRSAVNVALATLPPKEAMGEFAALLTELVEAWAAMIPASKGIVHRLSEELPISQAQLFWPLLVRLRAE